MLIFQMEEARAELTKQIASVNQQLQALRSEYQRQISANNEMTNLTYEGKRLRLAGIDKCFHELSSPLVNKRSAWKQLLNAINVGYIFYSQQQQQQQLNAQKSASEQTKAGILSTKHQKQQPNYQKQQLNAAAGDFQHGDVLRYQKSTKQSRAGRATIKMFKDLGSDESWFTRYVCCGNKIATKINGEFVELDCRHIMCKDCANSWFENHNACPECGKQIFN